ncbi:hypothetical protein [Sphaerimonospora thailandensis]|uniref:Uncharacterized protein n=1 Tax=Sphaerimonospora thailandensis TaxID=795644 RepID=A0A8J3W159_9ACTN|nr:hypothetical protein [Sphaerimonospora thailandensis]GIH72362.1 hypothetical protein Mth01_46150 [Sphaerimonospora thailandensis]
MSDLIKLGIGERPWLPTPSTEMVEIFDRYNMPIAGLIKQDDRLFVFDCVEGHVMEGNVWVYAHVESAEARRIQDAQGDDFARLFNKAFTGRRIMAALAIDTRIRSGAPVEDEAIKQVGLLKAVFDQIADGLDSASETKNAMEQLVNC